MMSPSKHTQSLRHDWSLQCWSPFFRLITSFLTENKLIRECQVCLYLLTNADSQIGFKSQYVRWLGGHLGFPGPIRALVLIGRINTTVFRKLGTYRSSLSLNTWHLHLSREFKEVKSTLSAPAAASGDHSEIHPIQMHIELKNCIASRIDMF